MSWARKLAEAVYYMVSTPEYYDYLEEHKDPAEVIKSGTDSFDYARRFNSHVFELVTGVPYFYYPRIEDLTVVDVRSRDAVLDNVAESKKYYEELNRRYNMVKGSLWLDTRFRESIE